jgi:hypothetical protein
MLERHLGVHDRLECQLRMTYVNDRQIDRGRSSICQLRMLTCDAAAPAHAKAAIRRV